MPQNKVNISQKVSRADIGFANLWISQHPLTVLGMAVAMGVVALALFSTGQAFRPTAPTSFFMVAWEVTFSQLVASIYIAASARLPVRQTFSCQRYKC